MSKEISKQEKEDYLSLMYENETKREPDCKIRLIQGT